MTRILVAASTLAFAVPIAAAAQSPDFPADTASLRAPLPLGVAVAVRHHNTRSPIHGSPDGRWIAHTVQIADVVARGASTRYSDTGFPFSEGNARTEATLSGIAGGDEVVHGSPDAESWAPVWSPDGTRVAFFSTEGGEAGLWVWNQETAGRSRVSDAVLPSFGLETPRWSPDGTRILVKVLPASRTVGEANAFAPPRTAAPPAPVLRPGQASVRVRRSAAAEEAVEEDGPTGAPPWIPSPAPGDP